MVMTLRRSVANGASCVCERDWSLGATAHGIHDSPRLVEQCQLCFVRRVQQTVPRHCPRYHLQFVPLIWRTAAMHRIESAGVAAMEMVAMEMKRSGMYCSRNLSFQGTVFDIQCHDLTPVERRIYDRAAAYVAYIPSFPITRN